MLIDSALPGSWDFLPRVQHTRRPCRASPGCWLPAALTRVLRNVWRSRGDRAWCLLCAHAPLAYARLLFFLVEIHIVAKTVSCTLQPGFWTEPTVFVSVTDRNSAVRFTASLSPAFSTTVVPLRFCRALVPLFGKWPLPSRLLLKRDCKCWFLSQCSVKAGL